MRRVNLIQLFIGRETSDYFLYNIFTKFKQTWYTSQSNYTKRVLLMECVCHDLFNAILYKKK